MTYDAETEHHIAALEKKGIEVLRPRTPLVKFQEAVSCSRYQLEEALRLYAMHDFEISDMWLCTVQNIRAAADEILENEKITKDG